MGRRQEYRDDYGYGYGEGHDDTRFAYPSYGDDYGYDGQDEPEPYRAAVGYAPSYGSAGTSHPVPNTSAAPSSGYAPAASQPDRKGRWTSVLALLMAICVVTLSVGGLLMPRIIAMSKGLTTILSASVADIFTAFVMGYGAIFLALLLEIPTVLLALRSASKPKGHVGRGRGLVSVVISVVFPVLCLMQLSFVVVKQAQSIDPQDVVPTITTDGNGHMRLVAPESWGKEMGDVFDQINEMSAEGYSFGVDENGNVTATNPDGKTVTITPDKLSEIEPASSSS